jgi:hypothetical protein
MRLGAKNGLAREILSQACDQWLQMTREHLQSLAALITWSPQFVEGVFAGRSSAFSYVQIHNLLVGMYSKIVGGKALF